MLLIYPSTDLLKELQSKFLTDFDDDSNVLAGFGLTYAAGANFRWRALLVGVEYGFGKVKVTNTDDSDFSAKVFTNVFKI